MQSSVAARSFEPVSFKPLQYEKTSCARCAVPLVGYDALSSRSSAVRESALSRKRELIEVAQEALLEKIGDADKYDMSWRRRCGGYRTTGSKQGERE